MKIKENIDRIKRDIIESAVKAGRNPDDIKIVAVTKFRPVSDIEQVIAAGILDIGENRVAEAEEKYHIKGATKHLIGRLQSNKVAKAVRIFDVIHSVESIKLAERIGRAAVEQGKIMPILVQINFAEDENKQGIKKEDSIDFLNSVKDIDGIMVAGLMTIGPIYENKEDIRPVFKGMKELFDSINAANIPGINLTELSMGMSGDYKIAVEEGATMVRIGTAIFI